MYNFYDDYEYDSFYEGANLDIRAKLKDASKIYKKNMKDIKEAIKAGRYNEARKNVETLRKSLADLREDIEKIDAGEVDSIIFGLFTSWTIHWLRTLISAVLFLPTLGLSGYVESIHSLIDDWGRPVGKIARGETLTADDANAYKNTALMRMNYLISACKRLDKRITQLADTKGANVKATATEVKKESVALDFKKALYEACNHGLITMEQREELLETSRANMYVEAANSTTYGFDTMSNEDQFKQVRRVLYERCKAGEISIDERDDMLLNARRKFF